MIYDFSNSTLPIGFLIAFPDWPFAGTPLQPSQIIETPSAVGTAALTTIYGTGTISTLGQPPEM